MSLNTSLKFPDHPLVAVTCVESESIKATERITSPAPQRPFGVAHTRTKSSPRALHFRNLTEMMAERGLAS
jgi:hypothetical protein